MPDEATVDLSPVTAATSSADSATSSQSTQPPTGADSTSSDASQTGDAETTEANGESSDDGFLAYLKAEHQLDLSEKFADETEAVKGLVEAYKLVGRRDDDARWAKQVRQAIAGRERDFEAFLSGQGQAQEPTRQQPAQGAPGEMPDFNEYRFLSQKIRSQEATPQETALFQRVSEDYARRAYDLVRQFDLKGISQSVQQQVAVALQQYQQQQAMASWDAQNASAIYAEGKPDAGFTPLGARFVEIYGELTSMPDGVEKANHAMRLAKAEMPKPKQTRPPSPHARHQAALGSTSKGPKTQADLLDEYNGDLVKAIMASVKQNQ